MTGHGDENESDTDQPTAQSQFDGPIEPSDYEAVRTRRCEICDSRTKHVGRDGQLVCTEDHTTADDGQQTLIPDGGRVENPKCEFCGGYYSSSSDLQHLGCGDERSLQPATEQTVESDE